MNDRSRPGKGGSEKTIAAVDTSIEPTADTAAGWERYAWHRDAVSALELLIRSGDEFTVDDLIRLVGRPPCSPKRPPCWPLPRAGV
jgi:hypothetical protein